MLLLKIISAICIIFVSLCAGIAMFVFNLIDACENAHIKEQSREEEDYDD